MVLPLAFALMGAGAWAGKGRRDAEDARMSKRDAAYEEDRQALREERERLRELRKDVTRAAAPLSVEENQLQGPVDPSSSVPGAAVMKPDGYRVGQTKFADRGEAEKMAAADTPQQQEQRVAGAYMKHGEYATGQQIRTNSRQGELADIQLGEAQAAKLDREYDRRLFGVPDEHEAVAQLITESKGDGKGGSVKATVVANPDKTVTYHLVGADGKTTPTNYTFPAGREGVLQAKYMLSKGVSPKEKLAHILGEAKTAEDRKRWEMEFGLKVQSEDRQDRHQRGLLARMSGGAGGSAGSAGNVATPDSTFDSKTAADIAKDQAQKDADAARDAGTPWTGVQIAKRTDEIVQSLRQSHTARFVEEAVTRRLGAAQADPQQYAALYGQAVQLGMPPEKLVKMGFKPPGALATPAAPAAASMGTQRQPPQPAPRAAMQVRPAAMKTGAEGFTELVAKNITSPQGKEVIARHVGARLPAIQQEVAGYAKVMALPLVSGPVKAQLQAKIDALAQEAQMMQTFIDGNRGF